MTVQEEAEMWKRRAESLEAEIEKAIQAFKDEEFSIGMCILEEVLIPF